MKLQVNREVTETSEKVDCILEVEEESSLEIVDIVISSIFGDPRPTRQVEVISSEEMLRRLQAVQEPASLNLAEAIAQDLEAAERELVEDSREQPVEPQPQPVEPQHQQPYYSSISGIILGVSDAQLADLYVNHHIGLSVLSELASLESDQAIGRMLESRGIRLRRIDEVREYHNRHHTTRATTSKLIADHLGVEVPEDFGMKPGTSRKPEPSQSSNLSAYKDNDQFLATLYVMGYSARAIGRAMDLHGSAVTKKIKKQGVSIRSRKESLRDERFVPQSVIQKIALTG
jgi:hypothetical protein